MSMTSTTCVRAVVQVSRIHVPTSQGDTAGDRPTKSAAAAWITQYEGRSVVGRIWSTYAARERLIARKGGATPGRVPP